MNQEGWAASGCFFPRSTCISSVAPFRSSRKSGIWRGYTSLQQTQRSVLYRLRRKQGESPRRPAPGCRSRLLSEPVQRQEGLRDGHSHSGSRYQDSLTITASPSSASAPRPAGWRPTPNCSRTCPPTPAWPCSWSATSTPTTRATWPDPRHRQQMPVREVAEGMAVEVNHVYVIPPGTNMAMTDGHLALDPARRCRPAHAHRPPVPLAGRASRRAGPSASSCPATAPTARSASRPSRPRAASPSPRTRSPPSTPACRAAAVLDGSVDHVLRPRDIAQRAGAHRPPPLRPPGRRGRGRRPPPAPTATPIDRDHRPAARQHRRRFHPLQADHHPPPHPPPHGPARHRDARGLPPCSADDAAEVQSLYQDFLIRVTQFFRDPEAFEALKEKVFPAIVAGPPAGPADPHLGGRLLPPARRSTRWPSPCWSTWTAGPRRPPIKILATDLNEAALEKARRRRLPRQHRDRRLARAAAAVLRPQRGQLPDQQGGPRAVRLLAAQHGHRPAVQPHSTWSAAATC